MAYQSTHQSSTVLTGVVALLKDHTDHLLRLTNNSTVITTPRRWNYQHISAIKRRLYSPSKTNHVISLTQSRILKLLSMPARKSLTDLWRVENARHARIISKSKTSVSKKRWNRTLSRIPLHWISNPSWQPSYHWSMIHLSKLHPTRRKQWKFTPNKSANSIVQRIQQTKMISSNLRRRCKTLDMLIRLKISLKTFKSRYQTKCNISFRGELYGNPTLWALHAE